MVRPRGGAIVRQVFFEDASTMFDGQRASVDRLRVVGVADDRDAEVAERGDSFERGCIRRRRVGAHALQKSMRGTLHPPHRPLHFFNRRSARTQDERPVASDHGIDQRPMNDVRRGGLVRVPIELISRFNQLHAEHRDNRMHLA